MYLKISFIFLFLCTSLYSEPSVYGFGQGNNNVNHSTVKSRTLISLELQLAKQKERIDGLTTIVEGLSATLNQLQQNNMGAAKSANVNNSYNVSIETLSASLRKIEKDYVTKKELNNLLSPSKKIKKNLLKENKTSLESTNKSNATLYSEGVRLFQKKRYDEAKKRFTITDTHAYKPAASNYYLGEIAYYTKKYNDAIFYFKKSAGLYDKAGYIDVLLLHAAISLEKIGDKKQAKLFYTNIVSNYQGKNSAKIAEKKLKRL